MLASATNSRDARTRGTGIEKLFQSFDEICSRRGNPEVPSEAALLLSRSSSVESLEEAGKHMQAAGTVESAKKPRPPRLPHPPVNGVFYTQPQYPRSPACTEEVSRQHEWQAEWSKLKSEEENLMAECSWEEVLQGKKMSSSQILELREELDKSVQENEVWSASVWQGLQKIRGKIDSLRHDGRQRGQHLQSIARKVAQEISEFKDQQREQFDALAIAEQGFEEIQHVLTQRYEGWVAGPSALFRSGSLPLVLHGSAQIQLESGGSSGSRSRGPSVDPPEAKADAEIEEIRRALEALDAETQRAGGATGGWSELHHDVFMRAYRQFKMQATPAFFTQLERRFPEMSKTDLVDHVRWFVEDEQRVDTKRRLLDRWKKRREELRREASAVESRLAAEEAEQARQAAERDRNQRAETKQRLAEWRSHRSQEEAFLIEKQREREKELARMEREQRREQAQQRESVEVYKHRKDAERAQALEGMKQAKEDKLRLERDHQREHLQKREMVDSYRRQRDSERLRAHEEEQQFLAASAARRALSQDDKQRIARRNHDLLKRRGQAPAHVENQRGDARLRRGSEPPGASASQRSSYYDVPSRLHDPTTSWTQKTLQAVGFEDKPNQNVGISSEPGWRCQLRSGGGASNSNWQLSSPPTVDTSLMARAMAVGRDSLRRDGAVTQPLVSGSTPRMRSR
mmetsp:Transcript_39851/g.63856  ORF Transcript_39851/g.63856 Transcript_39851/m.63856 type:complete len:687 (+) Transcript_39851:85-2145(+)